MRWSERSRTAQSPADARAARDASSALTQRFYDELTGIQYGTAPDPMGWVVPVA